MTMTPRARALRFTAITCIGVSVLFAAILVGCGDRVAPATNRPEPERQRPEIRFHVADIQPHEGYITAQDPRGETFYLAPEPALTEADVAAAATLEGERGAFLQLTLTPEGKQRLAQVTRENVMRRLAILVNGRIATAPVIQGEIPNGVAYISGDFSIAELEELATALNRG